MILSGLFLVAYLLSKGHKINSFFRSEELNKKVGGVPNSQHLYAGAIDTPRDILQDTKTLNELKGLGFKIIDEPLKNHVHIEGTKKTETFFRSIFNNFDTNNKEVK